MGYELEHLVQSVNKLEDTVSDTFNSFRRGGSMTDIAGLLALMQNNKNMDIPGLLALCRENGYDRSFGDSFFFLFFFMLMFSNGGWGGWGNRAAAAEMIGAENVATLTSLYDRIAAAQAASTQGFSNMQTWLCEAIANVTNSVRNQGDRVYDATRDVKDAVKDCCCKMQAELATINCRIDGVSRDIRESTAVLSGKIELSQERTTNQMQAMECRLSGQIKDLGAATALGFERQANLILNVDKEREISDLRRENADLKLARSQQYQTNAIIEALKTTTTTTT